MEGALVPNPQLLTYMKLYFTQIKPFALNLISGDEHVFYFHLFWVQKIKKYEIEHDENLIQRNDYRPCEIPPDGYRDDH